ncbi:MAG: ATP-binding protein [Clostridiales bacterium]|nr:ATP-binding protein [Clostridiales bacterium]
MKRAITLRIILVSAIALVLSNLVFGLILQKSYINELENQTYQMLKLASVAVENVADKQIAAKLVSNQFEGYRITIIAKDGTVFGDSQAGVSSLENHSNRPEVKNALQYGRGISIRHSKTIGVDMLYVAYQMPNGFILRASLPVKSVHDTVQKQIPAMLAGILVAIFAALMMAGKMSKTALHPLEKLSEGIRKVENGDYTTQLSPPSYEELSKLTKSINLMVQSIKLNIKSLNEQKQKLSFLLNSMRQGLIVVDQKQNIVHINHSAEMLFDAGQDLTGKSLICLTRDIQMLNTLERCLQTSGSAIFEINNESEERIYSVSINPISNEWLQDGAIIILTDVTQNAHAEQIRREFVTNASHELKTPITAIKGFAELLSKGIVTDPNVTKDYLDRIKNESDRITNIIEDILKLSELDEGKELHAKEKIDLLPLAEEVIANLTPQAEMKQLTVQTFGSGYTVLAEREDMSRLLTNLIENAIKYNVEGGTVEVTVDKAENGGFICVKDSGIGIPEKDIPRVFERFYRVDKGRSRKVSGTGLGLSIVKHVAAKYGAEIELKSKVLQGSQFTIRFH